MPRCPCGFRTWTVLFLGAAISTIGVKAMLWRSEGLKVQVAFFDMGADEMSAVNPIQKKACGP